MVKALVALALVGVALPQVFAACDGDFLVHPTHDPIDGPKIISGRLAPCLPLGPEGPSFGACEEGCVAEHDLFCFDVDWDLTCADTYGACHAHCDGLAEWAPIDMNFSPVCRLCVAELGDGDPYCLHIKFDEICAINTKHPQCLFDCYGEQPGEDVAMDGTWLQYGAPDPDDPVVALPDDVVGMEYEFDPQLHGYTMECAQCVHALKPVWEGYCHQVEFDDECAKISHHGQCVVKCHGAPPTTAGPPTGPPATTNEPTKSYNDACWNCITAKEDGDDYCKVVHFDNTCALARDSKDPFGAFPQGCFPICAVDANPHENQEPIDPSKVLPLDYEASEGCLVCIIKAEDGDRYCEDVNFDQACYNFSWDPCSSDCH